MIPYESKRKPHLKPPIRPEIVAAIRAAWEERVVLAPGIIARKWMYADLAAQFGVLKNEICDVVNYQGKYRKAPR